MLARMHSRGFGVRRDDMRQLLRVVEGRVFTLSTLSAMLEYTKVRDFVTKKPLEPSP